MKIWTVTFNDDNGITTEIAASQEQADLMAGMWLQCYWGQQFPAAFPMPNGGWRKAHCALKKKLKCSSVIHVAEHEINQLDLARALTKDLEAAVGELIKEKE